jgi:hypothetical protein
LKAASKKAEQQQSETIESKLQKSINIKLAQGMMGYTPTPKVSTKDLTNFSSAIKNKTKKIIHSNLPGVRYAEEEHEEEID